MIIIGCSGGGSGGGMGVWGCPPDFFLVVYKMSKFCKKLK